MNLFALIINICYIPLNLCFGFDVNYSNNMLSFTILKLFPLAIFTLNVFVLLNTAFYKKGVIITDKFSI